MQLAHNGSAARIKAGNYRTITLQRFGIRSIPTMVRFEGGREAARQSGALPAGAIVALAQPR